MENSKSEEKILLPHHEQQELCATRLPYRQGRKLTAVKVYSITKESNHLLIFGVPLLNLRQETKTLFLKFGKLLQFNISKEHAAEPFTETYHAQYERIHSARIAKRMLDTKNFYGGSLHVCYAPEMESIAETHQKLIQRQRDVLFRLKNLENEAKISTNIDSTAKESIDIAENSNTGETSDKRIPDKKLLNMGEVNVINTGNTKGYSKGFKRKKTTDVVGKRFKPCFATNDESSVIVNEVTDFNDRIDNDSIVNDGSKEERKEGVNDKLKSSNVTRSVTDVTEIEIVDCTSVDKPTISNINEALNYNKFGQEAVFKMPAQPVNKIKFNVNKESLIYTMFLF